MFPPEIIHLTADPVPMGRGECVPISSSQTKETALVQTVCTTLNLPNLAVRCSELYCESSLTGDLRWIQCG